MVTKEFSTIRERESNPTIDLTRSSVYHAFSSASNQDFVLTGRIVASMTIANTSTSVVPQVTIKAKDAAGDVYMILANVRIPIGATLKLDPDVIATPHTINVAIAVLSGTPAVQLIINI